MLINYCNMLSYILCIINVIVCRRDIGCQPTRFRASCIAISMCVALILLISSIIFTYETAKALRKYNFCTNVKASSTGYTRSASVSLLENITDFTCFEPEINAKLNDGGSVKLYQAECKNLATQKFPVHRHSLLYENVSKPIVVLSEDFDENYFSKGTIEVHVNASFDLVSINTYVCLFSDVQTFSDFTNYDKDWKKYVEESVQCQVTTDQYFTTTFAIESPGYVFIGIASTGVLSTLQFSYNGTGYNFVLSPGNVSEVCSLKDDKPGDSSCYFTVDGTIRDLCILASSVMYADGSLDYSTVTLSFPHVKHYKTTGVTFIALAIVSTLAFFVLIFLIVCLGTRRCSLQNKS